MSAVAQPKLKRTLIPPILQQIEFLDYRIVEESDNKYALSAETIEAVLPIERSASTTAIQLCAPSNFEKRLQCCKPKTKKNFRRLKEFAKPDEEPKQKHELVKEPVATKKIIKERRLNEWVSVKCRETSNNGDKSMKPSFEIYSPFKSGLDIDLQGIGQSLDPISRFNEFSLFAFNK